MTLLKAESSFIARMAKRDVSKYFINGSDLNIASISPRIHICRTREEFELYRYCRLLQAVPNSRRIGRQINALVFDYGQRTPVLIGAIGLASSMYTVGARDRYLNWLGRNAKVRKDAGLRQLMDLAVCIAIPPYSLLLGGKLLALLALSDPIKKEFKKKYLKPLLATTTTCATGLHCPIFHRIMLVKGGLYRRIGETVGYTLVFFSTRTMRAARILTRHLNKSHDQLSSKPIRIIKQALRLCGLPYEQLVRLGNPKAIYFGILSEQDLISLRNSLGSMSSDELSVDDAIQYWKNFILIKRRKKKDIIAKVRSFKREELILKPVQFGAKVDRKQLKLPFR